jgi:hypothetical protein
MLSTFRPSSGPTNLSGVIDEAPCLAGLTARSSAARADARVSRWSPPRGLRGYSTRIGELEGARLLSLNGRELFSAYVPSPKGPVFMSLIERTFGKELTTRTWDTVAKVSRA